MWVFFFFLMALFLVGLVDGMAFVVFFFFFGGVGRKYMYRERRFGWMDMNEERERERQGERKGKGERYIYLYILYGLVLRCGLLITYLVT